MSKQSNGFVNLKEQIENQKQKFVDVECKNIEKAASVSKFNESLNVVMQLMKKENGLHEQFEKELQKLKVLNSNMSGDMERVNKEHEMITKELEESKSMNVMLKRKFTEENQVQSELLKVKEVELEYQEKYNEKLVLENLQLKGKLDVVMQMEDEYLKTVSTLHMNLKKMEGLLKDYEDFSQSLLIKQCERKDEFHSAHKRLIKGIFDRPNHGNICLKRMGEIKTEPFLKALSAKKREYSKEEAEQRALEMCSLWQNYLKDPNWYPFKLITADAKSKEIIDDEDEKLKRLKEDLGDEVYNAVVTALKEMNEYNSSGRFIVSELWNKGNGRIATLEEGVNFLMDQTKTKCCGKHQTDSDNVYVPLFSRWR